MWCWPPALPRPPGCLRCLPMRPWPADTEPRFLRFLLNRVSGCVGGGGVSYARALSLGVCAPRGRASVFAARVRSRLGGRGVYLGAVPRPALAPLLPAAAGVGGDGLLGRRARRSSARQGFAVAGLALAFLAAASTKSLSESHHPSMNVLPFVCGRRFMPWLRLYSSCLCARARRQ
ncbi:unnamed protein product [Pelagomonas calceolata]|uniref:Uncharacterized protein n=1 Tax=Pelagomonas calceolata TaxID=35677 RepID=A0A8J2SMD5_9STRA|nr:unnamed protein product [Pelagomonas calceolata]